MRQAILLLALITPAARACFDTTRGGCFTAGFVDNLSSAEDCQAACAFDSACNYFAYHSARGDRRCHFCHDDRDVSQCAANVNNPSADARWRDCVWGPELCPGDIVDELTPQELLEDSVGVAARFCAGVRQGVAGIAQVQLMTNKFMDSSGSGWTSDAVLAIQYGAENGAHISPVDERAVRARRRGLRVYYALDHEKTDFSPSWSPF